MGVIRPEDFERLKKEFLNSNNINQFLDGYPREAPQINLELWPESERNQVKNDINFMISFLEAPLIIDKFIDHTQRRQWRNNLSLEERNFFENNSLRLNLISGMALSQFLLSNYIGTKKNEIEKIIEGILRMISRIEGSKVYDSWSLEDKINYVKTLKELIFTLLETLSKQEIQH